MDQSQPTEIKVTLGGEVSEGATDQVEKALGLLGLEDGDRRWVWFLEDLTPGVSPLPLLSAGIIARVRLNPKKNKPDEADSTIKLRPARRSQLLPPWNGGSEVDDQQYRIEADWAGSRRALAASCVAEVSPEHLPVQPDEGSADFRCANGNWSPGAAFTSWQHEFLRTCTRLPVAVEGLTCLGPVHARRWKGVTVQEVKDVVAERWRVGQLDFLELSIRVGGDAADPATAQVDFEAAVRGAGLDFPVEQETKTRRVLEHLAAQATTHAVARPHESTGSP
jgi:hypothetical protein